MRQGRYIFDTAAEGEDVRLGALELAFDEATFRHLAARGVGEGWRCLEVGAGKGSVARWLCDRVGEKGRVVATDLTTKLIEQIDAPNLEVRRHDIVADPLEEGAYDLVHSRLVLEHIPGREAALGRMAAALAPGGWLVVEDLELSWNGAGFGPGARLIPSVLTAARTLLRRRGHDARFARRVPVLFHRLGLGEIGAEGRSVVLVGGTDSVEWALPNFERFRELLLQGESGGAEAGGLKRVMTRWPVLRQVAGGRLDRLESVLTDPEFVYVVPVMVSSWGRRAGGPR